MKIFKVSQKVNNHWFTIGEFDSLDKAEKNIDGFKNKCVGHKDFDDGQ